MASITDEKAFEEVIEPEKMGGRKGEGVSEGVNLIIKYIKQNPGKRAPYIAKASGVPLKTLERWLKKLKAEGKIKYEGSAKTGGYHFQK